LSPATGEPIITPSQDMVLGCYYLTTHNSSQQPENPHYFSNLDDCLMAYSQKQIPLHGYAWIRFNETVDDDSNFIESILISEDVKIELFSSRLIKKSRDGKLITQYILTTPGRILLNKVLQDSLTFSI